MTAEEKALAIVVGKTIVSFETEATERSCESIVLRFADGTSLDICSCDCCGGMGVTAVE